MDKKSRERLNELRVLEWAKHEIEREPRHALPVIEVYTEAACEQLRNDLAAEKTAKKAKFWSHVKHAAMTIGHIAVMMLH